MIDRTIGDEILALCGIKMEEFKPNCEYCNQPIIWGQTMEQYRDSYFHLDCVRMIDHKWYRAGEGKPHE